MKKKMLSMAAAITMAVVVLTGCSNGFKKDTVIEAAKGYGMKETQLLSEAIAVMNTEYAAYYVSKDSDEAEYMRNLLMHTDHDYEFDLKETIVFSEVNTYLSAEGIKVSDIKDAHTRIIYITAKDKKNAKEIYDLNAEWIINHEGTKGTDNGVEYTITYSSFAMSDGPDTESLYGVYLKGDTVIWIEAFTNCGPNDECTEYFCNKLGLVSPLTLRK